MIHPFFLSPHLLYMERVFERGVDRLIRAHARLLRFRRHEEFELHVHVVG